MLFPYNPQWLINIFTYSTSGMPMKVLLFPPQSCQIRAVLEMSSHWYWRTQNLNCHKTSEDKKDALVLLSCHHLLISSTRYMLIYYLHSCSFRLNGHCQGIALVPSPNTLYESKVSKEHPFCIRVIYFISVTAKPSLHWIKMVQIPLCSARVKMKTPHKRAGHAPWSWTVLNLHHKPTQRAKNNYENSLKKAKWAGRN